MKFYTIILLLIFFQLEINAQSVTDQWLNNLNKAIDSSFDYDDDKLYKIEQLRRLPASDNNRELYTKYLKLYSAYAVFNYDSAYAYARKLQNISYLLNDKTLIANSKLKVSFVLLSSGMLKEVIDSLKNMPLAFLDQSGKAEYFSIMARCYYGLADYDNDVSYTPLYNAMADKFLDSALIYFTSNSFEHIYYSGLKNLKAGNYADASVSFQRLMNGENLSAHEMALTASTLSDFYLRKRDIDSAIYLLTVAAISDVRSSTKETSATYNLAILLYRQGDLRNASICIKKASADARHYGARQHLAKLSSIMPLIEGEQLNAMARKKKLISSYALIITIISVLLLVLIGLVIFQVKRLKVQQKEIRLKNKVLAQTAEEKDWLLKEVHHRVKNNLQMVMSLLNTQSEYSNNKASFCAIRKSRQRIYAMSLIHQKLYQTEQMTLVDLSMYIPELVDFLKDSFADGDRVRFDLQIAHIELDVSQAIPVGLILNELITNSIKYAFAGMQRGIIKINVVDEVNGHIVMVLQDNGMGLPINLDPNKIGTMGMQLIRTLAEQLGGTVTFTNENGLKVRLTFSQSLIMQRIT